MAENQIKDHLRSIFFVAVVFTAISTQISSSSEDKFFDHSLQEFTDIPFLNFEDSLDRALFHDTYRYFFPQESGRIDSLIHQIRAYRSQTELTGNTVSVYTYSELAIMYLKFVLIYAMVLIFTYYGVQSFAVWRFVREKLGKGSYIYLFFQKLFNAKKRKTAADSSLMIRYILKAGLKGIVYLILFSPAYVIAYSFKTRFDTNSVIFMIGLGIISNAFLITYIQKFYSFLVSESRKGYVETAVIKNLDASYHSITLQDIFRFRKSFPGHIFDHIFENARFQFFASVKEQASFLITGLVIIEMALNIQGHLSYTLLQTLLYEHYLQTLVIVFGIFCLVKFTEICIDLGLRRMQRFFENQPDVYSVQTEPVNENM